MFDVSAFTHTNIYLEMFHVLQLLEVSICGNSTLKIEYGDSSDKPKLASASMIGAVAAAGSSSEQQQQPGGLASTSASTVEVYGGGVTASSGGAAGSNSNSSAASIRVTFDYFTLAFKDPATAQEAAAALLFQRAQYAAMRQWLYQVRRQTLQRRCKVSCVWVVICQAATPAMQFKFWAPLVLVTPCITTALLSLFQE
jgi:hypothetical protein